MDYKDKDKQWAYAILGEVFGDTWLQPAIEINCPICGENYQHMQRPQYQNGKDNHAADWEGRGDLIIIPFWGECDHSWEWCIGFHKGNSYTWARWNPIPPEYYDYIKSDEWRLIATDAKARANWRCQVCNRHKDEVTLDAHHRTYERLGKELPEDITVLCRDCHKLYEENKNGQASSS